MFYIYAALMFATIFLMTQVAQPIGRSPASVLFQFSVYAVGVVVGVILTGM